MAKWISGQPYTRFRAIRLKDNKLSWKSGVYSGLLTTETLTADRTWTFPNETGELLTRGSEEIDSGTIVITSDSSVYSRTLDLLYGTAEIYIPRVEETTGNTDATIFIDGALANDLVFLSATGTSLLTGGTLIIGGVYKMEERSEYWNVLLQNLDDTEPINPAATSEVSYLVIS